MYITQNIVMCNVIENISHFVRCNEPLNLTVPIVYRSHQSFVFLR